jgi:hypothetical protein
MTYKITESDAIEGTTIEREATPEEIADIKARDEKIKNIKTQEASIQAAKLSALAKLAALGLTENEVNGLIS